MFKIALLMVSLIWAANGPLCVPIYDNYTAENQVCFIKLNMLNNELMKILKELLAQISYFVYFTLVAHL